MVDPNTKSLEETKAIAENLVKVLNAGLFPGSMSKYVEDGKAYLFTVSATMSAKIEAALEEAGVSTDVSYPEGEANAEAAGSH